MHHEIRITTLARRHAADRPGQDVIKHQRRDAELGKRSAHRFFDHAIDPAAHEHAAALHVDGAHGVRKQHYAEDEPRRGLADVAFRFAACIIGRRSEIVEDDRRGTPERNEAQECRRGNNDTRNSIATAACGSRALGSAAHVWVSLTSRLKCSHFWSSKSSWGPRAPLRRSCQL